MSCCRRSPRWDEATLQQGLQQLVDGGVPLPAGAAAAGDVPLQARPDPGGGLSVAAARAPASSTISALPRCWRRSFPRSCETQPELLAHHYTEAGLSAQAIPYWQRPVSARSQRSAHVEAIGHLTTGLEVLQALPDTPERTQQELRLHSSPSACRSWPPRARRPRRWSRPTPERASCASRSATRPSSFRCLWACAFCLQARVPADAHELAEQLLRQAERPRDAAPRMLGHCLLGLTLYFLGDLMGLPAAPRAGH